HTSLKQLLNTRQTLRNISLRSRNTSSMEGTHRQLCTRLTNRLSSDDTHCCSDTCQSVGRQILPITLAADTAMRQARQDRTYTHSSDIGSYNIINIIIR